MDFMASNEAVLKVKRWPKDTIAAGCAHTLGLQSDGTVVVVGENEYGQCDVNGWQDIQVNGHV